ncbi:MAG TPA: VWA domain-containing protein [Thermoanaerobaculia bacterium]|nr:VWA domain-containing protein [Thermoanaerobaculia bacterium]
MSSVRGNRQFFPLPLIALIALSLPAIAAGAEVPAVQAPAAAGSTAPRRFAETAHVVAVEVPVNVVSREGEPLRGLTAADFAVYDEGAAQRISQFEVLDLDALAPAAAQPLRHGQVEQLDSAARRHFLLLFDLSFSSPTAVLKARLAARDFVLRSLRPSDLAAVATFSLDTGFRLVVTFTPDRSQVARGIDTLGLHLPDESVVKYDPLHFLIAAPGSFSESVGLGDLTGRQGKMDAAVLENLILIRRAAERDDQDYTRSRITSMTRSLGSLAHSLNGVEGRKNVVLFSEGFDSKLMLGREELGGDEEAQDAFNIAHGQLWFVNSDNRYGNTKLQGVVHRMLEEFRRADCVIQAVDIGGLKAGGDARDQPRGSGQEALFYMANETGGELFKDANDFGSQLDRLLSHTTVTYLLTFERADLKADGAYHHLRVKAKLPLGARLSYRSGYYAPRPFRDLDPLEKSLLAAEGIATAAPRNDLEVSLLAAPFRASEQQAYVPVIVEMAGGPLLQGHRGDKLNIELYAYASDARGEMRDFFSQRVGLDVKRGRKALAAAGVKYYGHLDLPPGDYRVRVLVRNAETGRTGVRSLPIKVPSYRQADPSLLPPLFVEPRPGWVLVRERDKDAGQQQSVIYPFTIRGEPYVPAARPELAAEQPARLCLVAYNLSAGDLAVSSKVIAADGSALRGGALSGVERTQTGISGLDTLVATFKPTGLAAGSYVLQVAVTDPATGRKQVNSMPFEVIR